MNTSPADPNNRPMPIHRAYHWKFGFFAPRLDSTAIAYTKIIPLCWKIHCTYKGMAAAY